MSTCHFCPFRLSLGEWSSISTHCSITLARMPRHTLASPESTLPALSHLIHARALAQSSTVQPRQIRPRSIYHARISIVTLCSGALPLLFLMSSIPLPQPAHTVPFCLTLLSRILGATTKSLYCVVYYIVILQGNKASS